MWWINGLKRLPSPRRLTGLNPIDRDLLRLGNDIECQTYPGNVELPLKVWIFFDLLYFVLVEPWVLQEWVKSVIFGVHYIKDRPSVLVILRFEGHNLLGVVNDTSDRTPVSIFQVDGSIRIPTSLIRDDQVSVQLGHQRLCANKGKKELHPRRQCTFPRYFVLVFTVDLVRLWE